MHNNEMPRKNLMHSFIWFNRYKDNSSVLTKYVILMYSLKILFLQEEELRHFVLKPQNTSEHESFLRNHFGMFHVTKCQTIKSKKLLFPSGFLLKTIMA